MAYQPIYLPKNMGVGAGLDSLSASLGDLAEWKRQRYRDEQERQRALAEQEARQRAEARQTHLDFTNARAMAEKAAAEGNFALAEDIMRPFMQQMQVEDPQAEAAAIKKDMGIGTQPKPPSTADFYARPENQAQPQPQGGSALPDGFEFGGVQGDGDPTAAPAPAPAQGPGLEQLMQAARAPQPAQDPQLNPILAGFQKDRERQQTLAHKLLRGTDYMGRPLEINPGAAAEFQLQRQQAERERLAQTAQDAFATTDDPKVLFFNLVRSGIGIDAASKLVADMVEKQQAERARAAERADTRAHDKWKAEEGWKEAKERARIMAQRSQVITPGAAADNRRADTTGFGADYERWEKNTNVDKLTDAYDRFTEMRESVRAHKATGDVIGQRSALYNAARIITGPGVLTGAEFQNTVQNTGGLVASALSKLRKGLDGQISDQEAGALEKFVDNANAAIRRKAIGFVRNFDKKYNERNYFYQQVPDQVQSQRQALIDRFGLTEEEIGGQPATPAPGGGSPRSPRRPQASGEKAPDPDRIKRLDAAIAKMGGL